MSFHRCSCGQPVRQRDDLCAECWDDTPASSPSRASDFDYDQERESVAQKLEDDQNALDLYAEAHDEGLHRVEGRLG